MSSSGDPEPNTSSDQHRMLSYNLNALAEDYKLRKNI